MLYLREQRQDQTPQAEKTVNEKAEGTSALDVQNWTAKELEVNTQLYYLLVHVNLFGASYLAGSLRAVDRVLSEFG